MSQTVFTIAQRRITEERMPVYVPALRAPFLGQAEAGAMDTLQAMYGDIRTWCLDNKDADFCNKVLPYSVYSALGREQGAFRMPWWGWMIIGVLAAKMLRI